MDKLIKEALLKEEKRQNDNIELIASENYVSKDILELQGSIFTNKYAEGYPGKRYYGGCENVDIVENLAIEYVCKLFGCKYANVQPHSGSSANMAVYRALLNHGANCYGCSGYTAAGHNLNESMYYDDNEFGTVRILAADPSFPFYSIFRISNVPGMDDFIGIVLDRGGNVGFNRGTLFDLAFINEKDPGIIGLTPNVKFEMLRNGK